MRSVQFLTENKPFFHMRCWQKKIFSDFNESCSIWIDLRFTQLRSTWKFCQRDDLSFQHFNCRIIYFQLKNQKRFQRHLSLKLFSSSAMVVLSSCWVYSITRFFELPPGSRRGLLYDFIWKDFVTQLESQITFSMACSNKFFSKSIGCFWSLHH